MQIRVGTSDDLARVVDIHRTAFASTELGYQGEGELVAAIHADGDALVSVVAEQDGVLFGHALFSHMKVVADEAEWRAAGLAPVGVLPHAHGTGVGSLLIRAGLEELAGQGIQICFVLGHPSYYPRFGFDPATAAPFASPYAGPHFMAQLLDKGLQIPKSGRADYAAAFSR